MTSEKEYFRQTRLFSGQEKIFKTPIIIVGLGGIGSPAAFLLAKKGFYRFTLVDPDTVEAHNPPYTLYRRSQLGLPKVLALKKILQSFERGRRSQPRLRITTIAAPFSKDIFIPKRSVVIVGVDRMEFDGQRNTEGRRELWQNYFRANPRVVLMLEGRMAARAAYLYTIRPTFQEDVTFYEDQRVLYSDSQASRDTCAEQAIIDTTCGLACLISQQIEKFLRGQPIFSELILDLENMKIGQKGPILKAVE